MKKRNFITGFSAAFVAAIALVSCGAIRSKDGVVLTINGHEYTALDLFGSAKTPAAAEAKFNAVYKVAVRRYFEENQPGNTYMTEITRDTKLKVAGAKDEAKSNASKNGTKYDVEWEKILSTNGVDDETGLYNKFEYDLEKEKFEDVFYTNNYDVLTKGGEFHEKDSTEGVGVGLTKGYLQEKQPYHMKHILVKISASDKDNTSGEITEAEANKIYNVVKMLANGTSFEQVSDIYNDDTTAKDNKGSLGIMSRDTSFVNDFKLGVYMYEAFFGTSTNKDSSSKPEPYGGKYAKEALELESGSAGTAAYYANKLNSFADPTTADIVEHTESSEPGKPTNYKGIGVIPYGEILKLAPSTEETRAGQYDGVGDIEFKGKYATQFESYGLTSSDIKAKYYPRNVIFNKYFNKHNIMVITSTDAPTYSDITKYVKDGTGSSTVRTDRYDTERSESNTFADLPGFKYDEKTKKNNDDIMSGKLPVSNEKVLRDDNGRVILVFRSGTGSSSSNSNAETGYQGIHFVVIERSPFINEETDYAATDTKTASKTNLEEYYTVTYPKETNSKHPKYEEGTSQAGKDKHTYTNWILNNPDLTDQKTRSDTVKSELKKANDNLNTYIYEYLFKKGGISFSSTATAQSIQTSIDNWIKYTKRDASDYEKTTKWNDTWRTYYNSLTAQAEQRKEVYNGTSVVSRLVPEICVEAFKGSFEGGTYSLKDLFGVGGVFHD